MAAEPPAPWTQECPRSLRLEPGGLLVPAGTMRALLRTRPRLSLRYAGFGFEPVVRDDDIVTAAAGAAEPGMLAVCDWNGWADLLRLEGSAGGWSGSIDALPGRRLPIAESAILAVVQPAGRSGPSPGAADRLRLALRWPAALWHWRRVERAPCFGDGADRSVREKYDRQAADYQRMLASNLTEEQVAALAEHVQPRGGVLVAGCGAGGEVLHLARLGYRVTAFDVLPSMVAAAGRALGEAGLAAEVVEASLDRFDPGPRRFGAVYFTPLLYSFLAGRDRRVAALRRLVPWLEPDGAVMLSTARARETIRRAQIAGAFLRRRLRGDRTVERGDWYTQYLAPDGSIGVSFLHVFRRGEAEEELRAAGFRSIRRLGGHLVATVRP